MIEPIASLKNMHSNTMRKKKKQKPVKRPAFLSLNLLLIAFNWL